MIVKNSDLKTVINKKFKIFLFYGSNTGLLEKNINSYFKKFLYFKRSKILNIVNLKYKLLKFYRFMQYYKKN